MKTSFFRLKAVPPFRLDYTGWVLRRRPENIIDRFEDNSYKRILVIDELPVEIIAHQPDLKKPEIEVLLNCQRTISEKQQQNIKEILRRMFGMEKDLTEFYAQARKMPLLKKLVDHFLGVKPPIFPTVYEAALNAISCQQLSLIVGILLLNRLSEQFGMSFKKYGNILHAFPRPDDLVRATPEQIRQLGYSFNKAGALLSLSERIRNGGLNLESIRSLNDSNTFKELLKIQGLGRWSAQYIMLRGLGRIHVLPADDIGFQDKLKNWLGLSKRPDYEGVKKMIGRFEPYGGLIYFHLLLKSLFENGYIV
jgi:DNA-3-methyladenine glycosylase II